MFELRAKSTTETDVLMYGSVSEWGKVRAEDFIQKLSEAKAKSYERLNLKINCPGGSIFEGLAIMSQMNTQEIYITGIVEGMAASMGAVILQSCHKRKMVKGTRLMVHQGSGAVYGQVNGIRDYADLLESLNKTLAEILSRRSKRKDVKWIMDNWMADGKDTWFTPEQALAEGLIDEIIEGNVKPLEKETASLMEMAAHYSQFTDNTTDTLMKKEELIKLLGLKADATDAEVTAAFTAMKAKADAVKPEDKSASSAAAATEGKVPDAVVDGVIALAKAKGVTDDKQLAAIKKLAAIDTQAALDLIPGEAKPEGETKKEPVDLNAVLTALKGGGGTSATDSKNWDWKEWSKHPKEFAALLEKEPKKYAEVFKAEFGYEPSESELKGLRF